MNWNQLRYVLTIAEEKSITRAAQRLYLTQPSLSLSLKALEEELGTPLFTRGPDGLEPTYAGSLFCAWAAETDISFGRLNDKLSDIASGRRQLLRLGVSPHRGNLLLPTILSAFYRQFPSCEVHTVELSTTLLRLQLDAKQLDFIVDVPSPDTVTYCNELLLNEPILLAVPRSFLPRIQPQSGALELNGLHVLKAAADDWVLIPAMCRALDSQTAAVTVMRLMPEMDFVVEQGNRLWGCKYGIVDGQAVNEIYACALGDFRNWNSFAGLSADSYAAARGSDGPFTGAAACMGGVVFFKENCMERIYPAAGGGHQIVTVPCSGVRKGAERTVAVADGVVYYLGNDGVYAFDGSMPVCVSRALGDKRYIGGVGGGESGRYWLAAKEGAGTTELLVYDTQRKLCTDRC